MDNHDDARIEDRVHWRCTACEAINHGYCGEDVYICWRCGKKALEDKLDRDIDWTEAYPEPNLIVETLERVRTMDIIALDLAEDYARQEFYNEFQYLMAMVL